MARNKKNREQVPHRRFFYIGAAALVIALGLGGSYWYSQYRTNAAQEAVEQGDRLFSKGQMDEAGRYYQQAVELDPDLAQAHSKLGATHAALERFDEALPHFEQALKLAPDHFEAQIGLALSLGELGRFLAAEESYKKALAIRPDFGAIYYSLGYLYHQQGLYAEAAAQYEEAVRLVPTFLQARANLGRVYHLQHRLGEAIAEYQRTLADHPDEGKVYAHLGESYMALSQYAEARAAYRRAEDLGVELEINDLEFEAMIPGVLARQFDLASVGLVDLANLGHRIVDPELGAFRSYYSADRLERLNENRRARWPVRQPPIPPFQPWHIEDHFLSEAAWHVQARNEAFDAGDWATAAAEEAILNRYYPAVLEEVRNPDGGPRHAFPRERVQRLRQEGAVPVPTYESSAGGNRIWIWPRYLPWLIAAVSILLPAAAISRSLRGSLR